MAAGDEQLPANWTAQDVGNMICRLAKAAGQINGRYHVLRVCSWMERVATLPRWRTVSHLYPPQALGLA